MDQEFSMLKFLQKSIFITKIFGLTVFQYPKDLFKISWIGFGLCFLNISFNIIKLSGGILYLNSDDKTELLNLSKNMKSVNLLLILTFIASLVLSTLILIANIFNRKKIFKTLKLIEILEIEV